MKAIKITPSNRAAIEAALAAANGKRVGSTYTTFYEINAVCERAENQVTGLLSAAKRYAGAKFTSESGGRVPSSYKYTREGTKVSIERRSTGWFLVNIETCAIYKNGGDERLTLTIEQNIEALANFSSAYSVEKSA